MLDFVQLQAHAERIRASRVLGRSSMMQRLFDFLVECSLAGKAPKEIEVAIDVFGKGATFEVTRDAMVRVYIHKLRRKLDDYYAGPGRKEQERLIIPKGEYRFFIEAVPVSTPVAPHIDEVEPHHFRHYWIAGAILLLLVNAGVWFLAWPSVSPAAQELVEVRENGIWAPLLDDDRVIYVVLGDYYLFGELDDQSINVRRLVREFDINSRNDLERYLKNNPQFADRYMDVSLQYLPIAVANALQNVVPILLPNATGPRKVQITLASDLTPQMIKSSHIIYIGLISGMRSLSEFAFAGSQFAVGDTYDELIDRRTQQHYISQAGSALNEPMKYRDFGYFSTFDGPSGNHIVILAGTRDVALMHTAEALAHRDSLKQLTNQSGVNTNFEALYSVEALDRMNLDGRLIFTGKLNTKNIWSGVETSKTTPSEMGHSAQATSIPPNTKAPPPVPAR